MVKVAVTGADTPDITVLIVTYNHEAFIERALDSVSAQVTDRAIEIIVADDSSTDLTADIVRAWAARNPDADLRILPSQAQLGITANYARGFGSARGRFVAVLEGDDEWIAVDKIDLQAQALEDNPHLAMVANRVLLYQEALGESRVVPEIGFDSFFTEFSSEEIAEHNWFATFSACMYRREFLARIPAALFECRAYDWAINMAITEFGSAGLLPQAMSLYRLHPGGAWSGASPLQQAKTLREVIPTYLPILGPRLQPILERRLAAVESQIAHLEKSGDSAPKPATDARSPRDCVPIPRVNKISPRVSVVLTSYNNADYVLQSAQSVLDQTMPDFELIVVDDGSSDDSWAILAGLSDDRVRMYRLENNQGGAAALNYGIQEARSNLVAVINSDDEWEPTKLARQLEVLEAQPEVAAVFTGATIIDHHGDVILGLDTVPFEHAFTQPNRSRAKWLRRFFEDGNCLCHPSVLIRRSFYEDHGLYDNRLRQLPDFARWIELVKRHEIVVLSTERLVRFRVQLNGRNTSHVSEETIDRTRAEHLMVMEGFFSDCSDDLILEGFGDVLRQRTWLSDRERECLIAFLWLDFDYPLGDLGRQHGRRELAARLGDAESAHLLAARFGVTDLVLHRLGGYAPPTHVTSAQTVVVSQPVETPAVREFVAGHVSTRTLISVLWQRLRQTPVRSWPGKVKRVLGR